MRARVMATCVFVALHAATLPTSAEQKGKAASAAPLTKAAPPARQTPPPPPSPEANTYTGTVVNLQVTETEAGFEFRPRGGPHQWNLLFANPGHESWLETVKHALRNKKELTVSILTRPATRRIRWLNGLPIFELKWIYEKP